MVVGAIGLIGLLWFAIQSKQCVDGWMDGWMDWLIYLMDCARFMVGQEQCWLWRGGISIARFFFC